MDTVGSALAKKLRLRPGARAAVVGAPSGYLAALDPPDGVDVIQTLDGPPAFGLRSYKPGEARQTFH